MPAWLVKLLPAIALIGLMSAPAPAADAPKVLDEGHLFSDQAKKEADQIIADIARQDKKEVRVEAYSKPPADKVAEFNEKKKDADFRKRFFRDWAEERFRATGTNGVLVLMYRENERGYFTEVVVGQQTLRKDFQKADEQELQ